MLEDIRLEIRMTKLINNYWATSINNYWATEDEKEQGKKDTINKEGLFEMA